MAAKKDNPDVRRLRCRAVRLSAARVTSAILMLGTAIAAAGCERAVTGEPIADPRPIQLVITFAEPCHIGRAYLPPGDIIIDIAPKDDWTPNRCVASSVEVR